MAGYGARPRGRSPNNLRTRIQSAFPLSRVRVRRVCVPACSHNSALFYNSRTNFSGSFAAHLPSLSTASSTPSFDFLQPELRNDALLAGKTAAVGTGRLAGYNPVAEYTLSLGARLSSGRFVVKLAGGGGASSAVMCCVMTVCFLWLRLLLFPFRMPSPCVVAAQIGTGGSRQRHPVCGRR